MSPEPDAALNSLFTLLKKWRERVCSNEPPPAPSRKQAPEINISTMNEMVHLVHQPPGGQKPQLELVFFHGLQLQYPEEAHVKTWMSRDDSQFWLQTWLAESFPNARILTVSYESSGPLDMILTAENLLSSLTTEDVHIGQAGCPVVFVGHCLGGLILKELCLFASARTSQNSREKFGMRRVHDLFSNLRGMFFYGVPHNGSVLGDILHDILKGEDAPIEEIQILKTSSARRNESFNDLKSRHSWVTFGVSETRKTYLQMLGRHVLVSPEASTRLCMDQYYSVDADHYDICKPKGKTDGGFSKLEQFLREIQRTGVLEARAQADLVCGREYVVDQKGRAKKLELLLAQPNIHTVFVCGLSGVGKTTIAQQVFHDLSDNYEVRCFVCLDSVDSTSTSGKQSDQVVKEQVVARIVEQLGEVDKGFLQNRMSMISHLKGRKVLMVVDNVDRLVQLTALSTKDWLENSSSKLIITTNNPHVIIPTSSFEVEYMSQSESQELFNYYAFDGQHGPDDLRNVIQQVIKKCGNHPLTLKVLASFIRNMEHQEEEKLLEVICRLDGAEDLDGGPECRIWGKLMVCYDILTPTDREIFLDIATLFHGCKLSLVKRIWKACRRSTELAWDNLKRRFLANVRSFKTYSNGSQLHDTVDCIEMHQLLRNLGRSIACPSGTSIDKWRRIPDSSSQWEEIEVEGKLETLALKVNCVERIVLQENSFLKFHHLQYLILSGIQTTPERLELPRSLVYLRWEGGLFTACPVDFTGIKKLAVLELVHCRSMEALPPSLANLQELTWLELEGCERLRELPPGLSKNLEYLGLKNTSLENLPKDLGKFFKLERLEVQSAQFSLIPEAVGNLKSLSVLHLYDTKVTRLPESIGRLKKLEQLAVTSARLTSLPGSDEVMRMLNLQGTGLPALPKNIGQFLNLQKLSLRRTPLKCLPESVGDLQKLTQVCLDNTLLETMPNSIGRLVNLRNLSLRSTLLKCLPESVGDLGKLQVLDLQDTPLNTVPNSIGKLRSLLKLNLLETKIRTLPVAMVDMSELYILTISSTKWRAWPAALGKLHPVELQAPYSSLWDTNGEALESEEVEESCPSNSTSEQAKDLGESTSASTSSAKDMEDQPEESSLLPRDRVSETSVYPLAFDRVESLTLNGRSCGQTCLQPLFQAMQQPTPVLKELILRDFILAEEIPAEIGTLTGLQCLVVTGWSRLRELPESLGNLSTLRALDLRNNPKLWRLPEGLSLLPALCHLSILQCGSLHSMPRSFRCASPLDKSVDIGHLSLVESDSWRILESFFACCVKRVPAELRYVVEHRKVKERATVSRGRYYDELEFKVVVDGLRREARLHHCQVDRQNWELASFSAVCMAGCGPHSDRKTLVYRGRQDTIDGHTTHYFYQKLDDGCRIVVCDPAGSIYPHGIRIHGPWPRLCVVPKNLSWL
ncbi:unnamed protein product [Calypogeia fissa]